MKIIGLTGGIGTGKSTVLSIFQEYGAGIIDSDHIARALVEKDKPAYQNIVSHFSTDILNSEQQIDRPKLRQIIFDNPLEKQWLESYLHPLIRQEIKKQLEKFYSKASSTLTPYVIIDIPLLKDRKDFPFLNRILVVDCSQDLQIKRICDRSGLSESAAKQIIDQQISRQKRSLLADDLIMNNKDLDALREAVHHLHLRYFNKS